MVIAGFNLAPADYRRIRRWRILAAGVVVVLLLGLGAQLAVWLWLHRDVEKVAERLHHMEQELGQHEGQVRAARAGVPAAALKQYEVRVAAYNKIIEAGAFSWIGLLVELERSVPPHVYLREITPNLATGQVTLRGNARSFEDLTRLLRGLEERTAFRNVFLLRQGEKKGQEGGADTLDFGVSLFYRGTER
jgi:Tfp pilus assembly protein PilN